MFCKTHCHCIPPINDFFEINELILTSFDYIILIIHQKRVLLLILIKSIQVI